VPVLIDALKKSGKDNLSRSDLIRALGAIGKAAKAAVPLLIELSADENGYVAGTAVDALLNIDLNGHKLAAKKMRRSQKMGDDEETDDDQSEEPSDPRTLEILSVAHLLHELFRHSRAFGCWLRREWFGPLRTDDRGFTPILRSRGQ
jgi:hypothetical protein